MYFTCTLNVFKLLHALLQYAHVHPEISQNAISAFKRHLRYLSEAMVPLALYSSEVPLAEWL